MQKTVRVCIFMSNALPYTKRNQYSRKMSFTKHIIAIFEFFKEIELQIYCINDPSPKCTIYAIYLDLFNDMNMFAGKINVVVNEFT